MSERFTPNQSMNETPIWSVSPQSAPRVISRRALLLGFGSLSALALTGCYGDATYSEDRGIYTLWTERASRLETPYVYTRSAPGEWAGKEASHTPNVQVYESGGALSVAATVNHVMTEEHWVSVIYFKDQNYNIFYLQELLPQDGAEDGASVQVYTTIPEGVTHVMAFAYCNKHDNWRSEFVPAQAGQMG